jgi:hypothetical protein
MEGFEALLARASDEVEGPEANQALWDRRLASHEMFGRATCYEMVIPESVKSWDEFRRNQLTKLVHHLQSKQEAFPGGPHLLIGVWRGLRLYLYEGPAFLSAVAEIEGCPVSLIQRRILEGPPLLLGPGKA